MGEEGLSVNPSPWVSGHNELFPVPRFPLMLQCLVSSMTMREQLLISEQLLFLPRVARKGGHCVCACKVASLPEPQF